MGLNSVPTEILLQVYWYCIHHFMQNLTCLSIAFLIDTEHRPHECAVTSYSSVELTIQYNQKVTNTYPQNL